MATETKTYLVLKSVGIEGKFYQKGEQFTAALPAVVEQEGLYRKLYEVVETPQIPEEAPKGKKK